MAGWDGSDELDLGEGTLRGCAPSGLESYAFARRILPVHVLLHSLFYQGPAETCVRLMILFELVRGSGRASLDGIRGAAPYLEPAVVDSHVRSLYEGGWLELRGVDNTYDVSALGQNLLAVLHAADFGNLTPANELARAAQNARFGAELDGADADGLAFLLDQVVAVVEREVASARDVLQRGRPAALVAWSRADHARQLGIIHGVLDQLQAVLDEASGEFHRVVRLHRALQAVVAQHAAINRRLREWNVERLHSSETGYSVNDLAEAVLGLDDTSLEGLVSDAVLSIPAATPSLTTTEVLARFHAARRKLRPQEESFVYRVPDVTASQPLDIEDLDEAAALRERLVSLLADRPPGAAPLELDEWLDDWTFAHGVHGLSLLARLEYAGRELTLPDGRRACVEVLPHRPDDAGEGPPPGGDMERLLARGELRRLRSGFYSRILIRAIDETLERSTPGGTRG